VAEEAAHGSPNLFSVEPGLMIWTIVTFLVVLVVLRFTAWTPLIAALHEREKSIGGAIEDAGRIKSEAEALLAKHETMMDQIRDESRAILDEARQDGVRLQEELRQRAQAEAEEFKSRAKREIELQKDNALREIWGEAAAISTDLAGRVLGRTLDQEDHQRLVRDLLTDMRNEVGED
jgi:F-type H+-transporting ATPase subunit b